MRVMENARRSLVFIVFNVSLTALEDETVRIDHFTRSHDGDSLRRRIINTKRH